MALFPSTAPSPAPVAAGRRWFSGSTILILLSLLGSSSTLAAPVLMDSPGDCGSTTDYVCDGSLAVSTSACYRSFTVPEGENCFLTTNAADRVVLISAKTITINGDIELGGRGFAGGARDTFGDVCALDPSDDGLGNGFGLGAADYGDNDGGGGGSYGGRGSDGTGDNDCSRDGTKSFAGGTYGDATSMTIEAGSGGGAGSALGREGYGGAGGGAIWLIGDTVEFGGDGNIFVDGRDGNSDTGPDYGLAQGAGGGGSGGGILIQAGTLSCGSAEVFSAVGGDGGDRDARGDYGGGGGGGRVKLFYDAGAGCTATNANISGGDTPNFNDEVCIGGDAGTIHIDDDSDYDGDGRTGVADCDPAHMYTEDAYNPEIIQTSIDNSCNGYDDDCDGVIDDEISVDVIYYPDADGDGVPRYDLSAAITQGSCEPEPSGYAAEPPPTDLDPYPAFDCDDNDPDRHPRGDGVPRATEVCNGLDDDCDDDLSISEIDGDGDGYVPCYGSSDVWEDPSTLPEEGEDCDDADAAVFPGAVEVCDSLDNDCDDAVDGNDSTGNLSLELLYLDGDGDGYGDRSISITDCASSYADVSPPPYTTDASDCDDTDAVVFPYTDVAPADGCDDSTLQCERCDGVRNDCSQGGIPADESDNDNDGYVECSELYDDGGTPILVSWSGADSITGYDDCDDTDAYAYPGVARHEGDACVRDFDGDGYGADTPDSTTVTAGADCDDELDTVYPQTFDACDGVDSDCSGTGSGADDGLGDDELDLDSDGYVGCSYDPTRWIGDPAITGGDDCDDDPADDLSSGLPGYSAAAIYPDAAEICNDIDDNCDGVTDEDAADPSFWYFDGDQDGFGDATTVVLGCDYAAFGYASDNTDCDDADPNIYPDAPELCDGVRDNCDLVGIPASEIDNDGDGYVDLACEERFDFDGDGVAEADETVAWVGATAPRGYGDCDDNDVYTYLGVARHEAGCLRDFDGDGYGDATPLASSVTAGTDCDDDRAYVYPQTYDTCDGLDTNCSSVGETDSDADGVRDEESDLDGDRHVECTFDATTWEGDPAVIAGGDCEDTLDQVNPSQVERCNDGVDNDCDGLTDEDNTTDATFWYFDADQDGYGDPTNVLTGCSYSSFGYVSNNEDCDDTDPNVYPAAAQRCDGVQNDCTLAADGVPQDEIDIDADGYVTCGWDGSFAWAGATTVIVGTDCDPQDPETHPDAVEICDGQFNDCTFRTEDCADGLDGDGDLEVDCDDPDCADDAACGGAGGTLTGPEAPANETDDDADGYVECFDGSVLWLGEAPEPELGPDCDDEDPSVHPGATERCDGQLNDCGSVTDASVSTVPESEVDTDGDGYVACTYAGDVWYGDIPFEGADCAPDDPGRYPGAPELCDGQFNNCDLEALSGGSAEAPEDELDVDADSFVACGYDPARATWAGSVPPDEGEDCNDYDANVFPAAIELCDGQYNDCDDLAYDATRAPDIETDNDGDQFIECEVYSTVSWVGPETVLWESGLLDCDDTDPATYPGAASADSLEECIRDADGDGYGDVGVDPVASGTDCDDTNADVHPGAAEICEGGDAIDSDCDGNVNTQGGFPINDGSTVVYVDADLDGFGSASSTVWHVCVLSEGFSLSSTDCDDASASVHPGAPELCNERDEDCDRVVDEAEDLDPETSGCVDLYRDADGDAYGDLSDQACLCLTGTEVDAVLDGDTYVRTAGDCHDGDPEVRPGYGTTYGLDPDGSGELVPVEITERLDREDNDCDGFIPVIELDCDDDGSLPRLDLPGGGSVAAYTRFTTASAVGLTRCDAAGDAAQQRLDVVSCLGEPLVPASCDPVTGLWVVRYADSADGFGGRFEGGHRVEVGGVCGLADDCDDGCASRCPGAVESCDGIDNDCTDVVGEGSVNGVPAAMSGPLVGTVPSGELDLDEDGAYSCELLGGAVVGEDAQLTRRSCSAPLPIAEAEADCNNLCSWQSPSAIEVCDGMVNTCGGAGEGGDGDDDGHATCGAWSGGELGADTVFMLVHVAAEPDASGSTITPILLPRRDPSALDDPDDPSVVCDAELTDRLVAQMGEARVLDALVQHSYQPFVSWCAEGAGGGRCEVVELTLTEDADNTLGARLEDGSFEESCASRPEQLALRTVWTEERILAARAATVAWECYRLYGRACEDVTDTTPLVEGWDDPRADLTNTIRADARWWKELQRFEPTHVASGTVLACWGDPTADDQAISTVGGDCLDGDATVTREMSEGPADLVSAYWGEAVDCSVCLDGIDNNCDGTMDCEDPTCAPCFVGAGLGCGADASPCGESGSCEGSGAPNPGQAAAWLAALGLLAARARVRR